LPRSGGHAVSEEQDYQTLKQGIAEFQAP